MLPIFRLPADLPLHRHRVELWDEHPSDMSPALARHDTILTWAGDAAGGHLLKTTYWASQGHEEIAQVGGLVNRPDPCEFVQFDFIGARTRGPSDDNSHRDGGGPRSARV
ncbi:MAG: hypothetical protein WBZ40_11970 [Acidimicrobiia bacterium]